MRPRIQPYRQPNDARARLGEGLPAPAVPQRVRRRQPAGLAGAHDVSARRCRTPPSGRSRPGSSGCGGPGLEAALVAIDPQTGDILAMVGGADYRAQHVQPRDAQPAAAGFGVQAARLRRGARARLLAGVGAVEPAQRHGAGQSRSGARATRDGEQPDALTLRAALLESNNAGGRRSAAARRLARRAAARERRRARAVCRTCRRWRSAPASSRRSISPRPTRCFPAAARSRGRAAIISVFDADGASGARSAGRARAASSARRSRFR